MESGPQNPPVSIFAQSTTRSIKPPWTQQVVMNLLVNTVQPCLAPVSLVTTLSATYNQYAHYHMKTSYCIFLMISIKNNHGNCNQPFLSFISPIPTICQDDHRKCILIWVIVQVSVRLSKNQASDERWSNNCKQQGFSLHSCRRHTHSQNFFACLRCET
jgi:hypothetical protein